MRTVSWEGIGAKKSLSIGKMDPVSGSPFGTKFRVKIRVLIGKLDPSRERPNRYGPMTHHLASITVAQQLYGWASSSTGTKHGTMYTQTGR